MLMGQGAVISISNNQKSNTRISTEAELVAMDEAMRMILWEQLSLNTQKLEVKDNTMMQENNIIKHLEKKRNISSRNITINLNNIYFL